MLTQPGLKPCGNQLTGSANQKRYYYHAGLTSCLHKDRNTLKIKVMNGFLAFPLARTLS